MLVTNKNPQGYKEHVILFIEFAFGEGVTIIYWIANMKLYVSYIEESYKYTIIDHMENRALPMVMYCSHMMHNY